MRLVLLCLLAAACRGEPAASGSLVLKVVTINLRHDRDWPEERFPLIADEIVRLAPDVIGMQEVEILSEQSQLLLGLIAERDPELGYHLHEELKADTWAFAGEGIGILSRFPLTRSSKRDLTFGRVVTLDRLDAGGVTVDLYDTHLHNEGDDSVRLEQARMLLDFAASESAPALLTGDMNAVDTSGTIAAFTAAGFVDSYPFVHGGTEGGATSPIPLAQEPVAAAPTQRIDYVFYRETATTRMRALSSIVCFDRPGPSGLYPSDHFGVMSEIELVW